MNNKDIKQAFIEDKIYKNQPIIEDESNCCGAGIYTDSMICVACGEPCDYAPELCRGCGDVEVDLEIDGLCCSSDCWKLYSSETFYDD